MATTSFRDLEVWQDSMAFVDAVYAATRRFPVEERFGLSSQLRRAAVSIPANIAEGRRRRRDPVLINHLEIALGSQGEIEVELEIARRLGYLNAEEYETRSSHAAQIGRILTGLVASLRSSQKKRQFPAPRPTDH